MLQERLEFPVDFGRQDYWIGAPLMPEMLATLSLKERKDLVLAAMNSLGPELSTETPLPADPTFGSVVQEWRARTGASLVDSVFFATLAGRPSLSQEMRTIVDAAQTGKLELGADARSQWIGRLAKRLYGPRGPRIRGLIAQN
jgi:hypothetical protein